MANAGTILVKNEGQIVAEDVCKKILELYPNMVGYAMANNGTVSFSKGAGTLDYEGENGLKEMMELTKDDKIVFYFGKDDNSIMEESTQPFVLVENEDNACLIAAFLEGNFKNYETPESSQTNEYHATEKFFADKIFEIFSEQEQDFDKTIAKLESASERKLITEAMLDGSTVVLVFGNGTVSYFAKENKKAMSYPWGWLSNNTGIAAKGDVEEKPAAKAKGFKELMEERKAASGKTSVPPTKPATEVPSPSSKLVDKPTKTETREAPKDMPPEEKIAVPSFKSKNERKKWFARNLGKRPEGWEYMKDIPASWLKTGSALRMSLKSVNDPKLKEAAEGSGTRIPVVLAAEARRRIVDKVLPTIGPLKTKEELEALEEENVTVYESLGIPMKEWLYWSDEAFYKIIKHEQQLARMMMCDMRNEIVNPGKDREQIEEEETEKKEETPASPPSAPPAKKTLSFAEIAAKKKSA